MVLEARITSERLTLPLWDAATVAAIRGGGRLDGWHRDFPREDDRDAASLWREGDVWGPRSIVRGTTVLGSIGFFGPPSPADDGVPETEVGYGLVAEAWGWGFATEALRALLAHTDQAASTGSGRHGVRIRASVAPENARSLRVLAKCGFTQLRGPNDEGELVLARPLPKS